ncbi:MAG: hypothetical protein IJT77_13750 [Clostridia bacterium]|nr:hypothetical protein [Clostridia bacterium]
MKIYCVFTDSENLLFTTEKSEAKAVQKTHKNAILNSIEAEPEPGETLEAAYMRAEGQMLERIRNESRAFLGVV